MNSAPLFSRERGASIWGTGSGTGSQASDTAKKVSSAILGLETAEDRTCPSSPGLHRSALIFPDPVCRETKQTFRIGPNSSTTSEAGQHTDTKQAQQRASASSPETPEVHSPGHLDEPGLTAICSAHFSPAHQHTLHQTAPLPRQEAKTLWPGGLHQTPSPTSLLLSSLVYSPSNHHHDICKRQSDHVIPCSNPLKASRPSRTRSNYLPRPWRPV